MKTLQFVENMESQIDYWVKDSDDAFDAKNASLWVLDKNKIAIKVTHSPDVYEMLGNQHTIEMLAKHSTDGFVISTCGWAARIDDCDDDTPPSQAPGKRRVRLVVGATTQGVASIVRFKDTPNECTTDEDTAKGSLADAIKTMYLQVMVAKLQQQLGDTNE